MSAPHRDGTAEYYARYRRTYPPHVVAHILERSGLDGRGRLMDGGCGTGQAFLALAPFFESVFAFDADEERTNVARRIVEARGLANITLGCMKAEEIGPELGPFRMAVFAASFHWMDRLRVAERAYDVLEPGGHLVVIAPSTPYARHDELDAAVTGTLFAWIAAQDGPGMAMQRERHAEVLARTRFAPSLETTNIHVDETWTSEELLGWMRSTSFASQEVLGVHTPAFERDLSERLAAISPDGRFVTSVEYTIISGSKPRL